MEMNSYKFRKKIHDPQIKIQKVSGTQLIWLLPKSQCTERHFYGTENEICAGFGQVGNTGKKIGPIMSNL